MVMEEKEGMVQSQVDEKKRMNDRDNKRKNMRK